MLQHHRSHGPVPVADVKPAATVAGAVADDMDMHVDGFKGRGGWRLGFSHSAVLIWLRKEIEESFVLARLLIVNNLTGELK